MSLCYDYQEVCLAIQKGFSDASEFIECSNDKWMLYWRDKFARNLEFFVDAFKDGCEIWYE